MQTNLQPVRLGVTDGYYECEVLQVINATNNDGKMFDLNKEYYLFLAEGPSSNGIFFCFDGLALFSSVAPVDFFIVHCVAFRQS